MSVTQLSEMSLTELETFMFSHGNDKPKKPIRPQAPTADQNAEAHRAFAVELDRYEENLIAYNKSLDVHQATANTAHNIWMEKLKDAVAKNEPQEVFIRTYQYAYHQHHSSGLYAVREAMFELMDLVRDVRNVSLIHVA